jgi:hypothetical protein
VRRWVDLWDLAVHEPAEDTVGGIDFWGLAQYYDNGDGDGGATGGGRPRPGTARTPTIRSPNSS